MCEENLSDEYLFLEDWKMTKDRIKHFDDVVMRIRVQAIPISSAFLAIGWGLYAEDKIWAYYIFLFAALYIIPIAMLDWFHYRLLKLSVAHAIDLENNKLGKKIQITNKLTTPTLTWVHNAAAAFVYAIIFFAAIISFCITKGIITVE